VHHSQISHEPLRPEEKIRQILASLSSTDLEALSRFYGLGEEMNDILRDLGITEVYFRTLKSRVRSQFQESGRTQ
jgi:hypothetical protein